MFLIFQVSGIEPVVKDIPGIIKEASQSQLGILALLIIVLFGLAIYFFRNASVAVRLVIFFAFLGGVVAYGWELNRVASKPEATHYTGRVLDRVTTVPVHEAQVTVVAANKRIGPYRSDSEGDFSFWLARKSPNEDANVHIEHDGYRAYDRTVSSDQAAQLGEIRIEALVAVVTPPTPLPNSGGTGGSSADHSPGSRVGSIAGRQASAVRIRPVPPVSTMLKVAAPPHVVEVSSGKQLSGKGKDWSPWYEVRVGPAPQGFTIKEAEFWLTGDRTCGAWSECKETVKSDNEVVWSFRLQGHDEWGAPPQAYSEGHLRVTYVSK